MTVVEDYPSRSIFRIATPLGVDLLVEATSDAIVSSRFCRPSRQPERALHRHPERERAVHCHPERSEPQRAKSRDALAAETRKQVDAYFKKKLAHFDLPLAFDGTAFECAVWNCVARLRFGEFVSYADVARAIGRPLSHRGVALAMGKTPFALFVPAHRVVGADGKPRGLSPKGTRARLIRFERGRFP